MMMRLSIVTVCYNSATTIGDTLRSVEAQQFEDYEHIVIDGASTDNTLDVVRSARHPRLQVHSEPDKGIYDAMNKGLFKAKGDYVQFLNSDDYLASSDALSAFAEAADQSDADCIFGETAFVNSAEHSKFTRFYGTGRFRPWWLRVGAMPPHPSMFVKRDLMLRLGAFDTSYRYAGDFDFIARALLRERARWIPLRKTISCFRVGGVSTGGVDSKLALSREMSRSLRSLGYPIPGLAVQFRLPLKLAQFRRSSPQDTRPFFTSQAQAPE
jgi:glycosyltransferase involved in cell wall biosynthesis